MPDPLPLEAIRASIAHIKVMISDPNPSSARMLQVSNSSTREQPLESILRKLIIQYIRAPRHIARRIILRPSSPIIRTYALISLGSRP